MQYKYNYVDIGKELIHVDLYLYNQIIQYLLNKLHYIQLVEYNYNRILLLVEQRGRCYVTDENLTIGNM